MTARERDEAAPFLDVLRRDYVPNKIVVVVVEGTDLAAQSKKMPLVEGKVARKGKATAYVCQRGVCKLPTTDVDVFAEQLRGEGRGEP